MHLKEIRVDAPVFRRLVDDVRRLLDLSWKTLGSDTDIDEQKLKNFVYKGVALSADQYDRLADFIDRIGDGHARAYLCSKYPDLFHHETKTQHLLGIGLAEWGDVPDQHMTAFSKRCVGRRHGRYLTLRRDGEGYVVVSLMFVSRPKEGELLPRFTAVRRTQSGGRRRTTGFIFEVHGRIYAVGKLDKLTGLRFTSLHLQEKGARSDLFGVRLGVSRKTGDTYATRLYCYQLTGRRTGTEVNSLIGRWHPDTSPNLPALLPSFPEIYELLHVAEPWDNGIRVRR